MGNIIETLAEPIDTKHTDRGTIFPCRGDNSENEKNKRSSPLIQYAASSMQGWRVSMEDAHLLAPSITIPLSASEWGGPVTLGDHACFAVFDGHGGNFTSSYARHHMLRVLTSRPEWAEYLRLSESKRGDVPGIQLLKAALEGAFFDLDEELRGEHVRNMEAALSEGEKRQSEEERDGCENSNRQLTLSNLVANSTGEAGVVIPILPSNRKISIDRSGSTSVVVILTPTHIICANAGDSRAILVKAETSLPLSFDHKPTNVAENLRIKSAGGEVKMKRIDGDLAVSRGLGDFRFKDYGENPEEQKVTCKPDVMIVPRNESVDEFIVLACDGIWDVMDSAECHKTIQGILDLGETDVGLVCEELLDKCLHMDSRDNMTVCLIALQACKFMKQTENCSGRRGGVKALREERRVSGKSPVQTSNTRKSVKRAGTKRGSALNRGNSPTGPEESTNKILSSVE